MSWEFKFNGPDRNDIAAVADDPILANLLIRQQEVDQMLQAIGETMQVWPQIGYTNTETKQRVGVLTEELGRRLIRWSNACRAMDIKLGVGPLMTSQEVLQNFIAGNFEIGGMIVVDLSVPEEVQDAPVLSDDEIRE